MRHIFTLTLLATTLPALAQIGGRPGPPPGPNQDPWSYNNNGPNNWDQTWNNRTAPRRGACFFHDANFRGNHFCVRSGDRLPGLPGNFGGSISSIQMLGPGHVQVYGQPGFKGAQATFRTMQDLGRVNGRNGRTWNDRIQSIVVF